MKLMHVEKRKRSISAAALFLHVREVKWRLVAVAPTRRLIFAVGGNKSG